ncbi:MAG: tripartite tricarboxylate transporter TctB family protein, partial [Betaproteobacteria bacterium]|nr:tripartite tricarboxylate transporter TctB family protein [Betaproteobacteria bacterium]
MMNLRPTRIAGLILLALSLLAGWQVSLIPSPPVYAEVGPHLVPGVAVLMLGLL